MLSWSPTGKPVVPKGETQLRQQQLRPFDAQHVASLGHPPGSEIRRSKIDSSLRRFRSGVTHSSTAKAVVSCVGG
jgi:hypothetical protein